MTDITWRNPLVELPEDGELVGVIIYHWKNRWPLSAEIGFGEVESYVDGGGDRRARVNTCDWTGGGSSYWNFSEFINSDVISGWCYANEFKKPDFLRHSD